MNALLGEVCGWCNICVCVLIIMMNALYIHAAWIGFHMHVDNKSGEKTILMEGSMLSRNFGNIHGCKSLHDSADARPSSHHCCCGWLGWKASIPTVYPVYHNKLLICRWSYPKVAYRSVHFEFALKSDAEWFWKWQKGSWQSQSKLGSERLFHISFLSWISLRFRKLIVFVLHFTSMHAWIHCWHAK